MKQKYILSIVFIFCVVSWAAESSSHPGRTDEKGGHHNLKTGEYHYHHNPSPETQPTTPEKTAPAEMYIWVDDRGVSHITDRPPENTAKVIGKEKYKKDSPEEIRQYQTRQKQIQIQMEKEAEVERHRQQYQEAVQKTRAIQEQSQKESALQRAKRAVEFEEKYQKLYEEGRRNANSQREIDMYNDLKKNQDKEVDATRRRLRELESKSWP